MWLFLIGIVVGGFVGFVVAALLSAGQEGDHLKELAEAYNDGVKVGMAKPGATLRANVSKMDRGCDD